MQLSKDWELDLPHDEFMAIVKSMVRPGYLSRRSWSAFDSLGPGDRAKGIGALGKEFTGRSQGRQRAFKDTGDGIA